MADSGPADSGLDARDCVSLCPCREHRTGRGNDACFLIRCAVTERSGWGDEECWNLLADCWNGVVLAAADGRTGPITLSLGLSCLKGEGRLFFISLPKYHHLGLMVG